MLNVPGRDSESAEENFKKAISALRVAITGWIEERITYDTMESQEFERLPQSS